MSITTDEVDVPPDLGGVTLVHWPREEGLRERAGRRGGPGSSCSTRPRRRPSSGTSSRTGCGCRPTTTRSASGPTRSGGASGPPSPPWPVLDADGILREGIPLGGDPARSKPASWRRCCNSPGQVVPRRQVVESGWPGGAPNEPPARPSDHDAARPHRAARARDPHRARQGVPARAALRAALTSRTVVVGHGPLAPRGRARIEPRAPSKVGSTAIEWHPVICCTLRGRWGRRGPEVDRQLTTEAAARTRLRQSLRREWQLHVALRVQPAGRRRLPPHPPRADPGRRPHGRGPRRPRRRRGIGRRPHADRHRAVRPGGTGRLRPAARPRGRRGGPQEERRHDDRPSPTSLELLGRNPTFDPESPIVQLAMHEQLRGLIEQYVHMHLRLHDINVWLNLPSGEAPQLSQRWHRDEPDDRHILKAFIYLRDVTVGLGSAGVRAGVAPGGRTQGPPARHLGRLRLPRRGRRHRGPLRADHVLSIPGRAGTIVVCDTRGYHRGGWAVDEERLVMMALLREPHLPQAPADPARARSRPGRVERRGRVRRSPDLTARRADRLGCSLGRNRRET